MTASAALCSLTDVGHLLGRALLPDDLVALAAIAEASAIVRGYCRQQLSRVVDDVVVLDGPPWWGGDYPLLRLPELPVISISNIVEEDVTLAATSYQWSDAGLLRRLTGAWKRLTITYTHGYADSSSEMELIRGVCTRIAARRVQAAQLVTSAMGVQGIAADNVSYPVTTYAAPTGEPPGLTGVLSAWALLPSEAKLLDAIRLWSMR